ncbi:hypothetical protein BGZ98_002979, partial [Dissophora globulifera]
MANYRNNLFNHLIKTQDMAEESDSDNESSSACEPGTGGIHPPITYPWSNYSLPQLRELLRQRGQLTTGSKHVLKKRLKNLERSTRSDVSAPPATTTIDILSQHGVQVDDTIPAVVIGSGLESQTEGDRESKETKGKNGVHPLRSRITSRSNSFSAHFAGPHIAEVTLAAYNCGNTDFDVRGDHRFVCKSPQSEALGPALYVIFRAVQWESFFWGFGTAIGELPPYFVAKA